MEYFSITNCSYLQHVYNPDSVKTARAVYVLADELIGGHGNYLVDCLPCQMKEDLSAYTANVQNAIMFQAFTMAMESYLGGAVRQEQPEAEQEINQKWGLNMVVRCMYFASWPYRDTETWGKDTPELTHFQNQLRDQQQFRLCGKTMKFDLRTRQYNLVEPDDTYEFKKEERLEKKIMQLEKGQPVRMGEDEVFEYGVRSCMQFFSEECVNILKKYNRFCALHYSERAKEFDTFRAKVLEINGLSPRPISRHNEDNTHNNTQNHRG